MSIEEGWQRRFAFVQLGTDDVAALLGEPVLEAEPLSGGLRNTNYRVRLEAHAEPLVLRLYTAEAEACAREAALLRLVQAQVPVPRVVRSEPNAAPPWMLMTFIAGQRLDHVLARASPSEVEVLARSAGAILARIHAFTFERGGFLDAELEIAEPLGPHFVWSTMLEEWLLGERVPARLGVELSRRLLAFVRANAWRDEQLRARPASLLHADYKPWNLLGRDGQVAAVLDWEFAFAGTPLNDIGIFLRSGARQPPAYAAGFIDGYRSAGGTLPADWQRLSRLVDLISLCGFLERETVDQATVRDVRTLVGATLDAYS
jgi:aminoglycoside phosphotransferase (APT) family kinase protein